MKTKSIISFIFMFNFYITFSNGQDSVTLSVKPDTIKSCCDYVYYIINNYSSDTLILIDEFYVEGLTGDVLVFPLASYYYPNLLFLEPVNKHRMEVCGIYSVYYYKFPQMILILPKSTLYVKLTIAENKEIFHSQEWITGGWIRLARKKNIDAIVRKYYSDRYTEYNESLKYTTNLYSFVKDKLPEEDIKSEDRLINLILEAFDISL